MKVVCKKYDDVIDVSELISKIKQGVGCLLWMYGDDRVRIIKCNNADCVGCGKFYWVSLFCTNWKDSFSLKDDSFEYFEELLCKHDGEFYWFKTEKEAVKFMYDYYFNGRGQR